MPQSKTAKRRVVTAERIAQAFELRKAGATCRQIAKLQGISYQAVHKNILKWLEENHQYTETLAEDIRRLEVERLDALLLGLFQGAKDGDCAKVDRVLKIMERRARLLGLDMPQKLEITTHEDRLVELTDLE